MVSLEIKSGISRNAKGTAYNGIINKSLGTFLRDLKGTQLPHSFQFSPKQLCLSANMHNINSILYFTLHYVTFVLCSMWNSGTPIFSNHVRHRYYVHKTDILSRDSVTIDGVWIGYRIYWTL
jgi:hypothetical protein